MAPRCSAAESTKWNSGRLVSMIPIVSPGSSPIAARPRATASTRSAYSRQVQVKASSLVRIAGRSGLASAVS